MSAHGTLAAYRMHYKHGEAPCEACKDAKRAYQRERTRVVGRSRRNYTFEGYHPDDGLGEGQWVRVGGILRWDGEVEGDHPVPVGECGDCGSGTRPRALYCEDCATKRRRAKNRNYMQAARSVA